MSYYLPGIISFIGHQLGAPLLHPYSMAPTPAFKNDIMPSAFMLVK